MKRIYSLIPKPWGQRLRNVLEFDGGVTDSHTTRASNNVDPLSGYGPRYRPPPASMPQARIPNGPTDRVYNIQYYTRDVRRNADPTDAPIEASFSEEGKKLLEGPSLIEAPKLGSPGVKNPDVERYDRSGLRSAMTATHAALNKQLAKNRANHLPTPVWDAKKATLEWIQARPGAGYEALPGKPAQKPGAAWHYAQANEW